MSSRNMTPPRVIVGIPFFNEEKHLGAAVRSILGQTFRDFELVLVDDGSTDGSLSVAKSFDDPRITVFSDGKRKRLAARLNEIVEYAASPFVARMDADDVAHPTRLEKQLAFLERDPSCDVVGSWAGLVDDDGALLGMLESPALPASARIVLERGLLIHPSILARRTWFRAHPYDEALTRAEDRDLWCRSISDSTFGVLPEPLHVLRISPEDSRFLKDYLDAQRQNRQLYVRYGPRGIGHARSAQLWMASLFKSGVMHAAVRLRVTPWLVRRRGRPATDRERAILREAIDAAGGSTSSPQRA